MRYNQKNKEGKMEKRLKEQWEKLYYFSRMISDMDPWDTFTEDMPLVYIQKDTNKEIIYSILGDECPFCGIACYDGWMNYSLTRQRMKSQNKKNEPFFLLQNALIGIWGSRSDVSKENYAILKELDLRGHGDGSWLYFEKYRTGFAPVPVPDGEVEELADSMGNLYMLLKAVYEHVQDAIRPGVTPIRTYDPKTKAYYLQCIPTPALEKPQYPIVTVEENDQLIRLKQKHTEAHTIQMDWSYIPSVLREGGKEFFPRLLIAVTGEEGFALPGKFILADRDQNMCVLNALTEYIDDYGKPTELRICDEELHGIIADFCKKVGIKLKMTKTLPQLNRLRKEMMKDLEF